MHATHEQTAGANAAAGPPPTPGKILDTLLFGHARVEALKGAIELDVFTAIAEGWRTAETIAERCSASPRGIRRLCDFLVVDGFLAKNGDEYSLTPDTRTFLDKRSPLYFGTVADFTASPQNAARWATLADCVRKGSCVSDISSDAPKWVTFARSMVPLMMPTAAAIVNALNLASAGPIRVLDVAASHGEYGLAIARANPQATIVGLDFPDVVAVALERAKEQGLDGRYEIIAGSAFDVDLGGPYDIVLVPNFLHHFEEDVTQAFLRKVAAALKPGGRVVLVEFIVNDDRVSPPFPAMFGMTMLTMARGDAFTLGELDALLRRAGLGGMEAMPAFPTPQTIVVARRT